MFDIKRNSAIPASYLVLIENEKILLGLRENTGYMDGYWSLPSGHVEPLEAPTQGLIREAKEELGIEISSDDLKVCHILYRALNDVERVDFFFYCDKYKGEIFNAEPEKCKELKFLPLDKLPFNIVAYVLEALKAVGKQSIYSEYSENDSNI